MTNIDANTSLIDLTDLFNKHKVLYKNEILLEISTAGEGNMNVVLRVKTNSRSLIFKQS